EEPWKVWKTDLEAVKPVMWSCLEIIATLGIMSKIFLPRTSAKIFDLLQIDGRRFTWEHAAGRGGDGYLMPPGHVIQTGKKLPVLFEQIPDELVEAQLAKLEEAKRLALRTSDKPLADPKEEIEFGDWLKLDIRVGTILEAQKVPKADKLLQFKVDTGLDVRTIVSGVAKFFAPEDLVGKQVPVLVNLKPRKIRGVLSQGMILFPETPDGDLLRMSPADEVDPGSVVA
ncbi:MAG: methionine--tRNA ligase subunit beta, partial [Bacteroidota bacterium]